MVMDRDSERQAEKQLVKDRSRIDEVVRELAGCDFKAKGPGDLWACCPFHTEDTPSFHVLTTRGMFKCFGCGQGGDVFSFVQKIRGVDFKEALGFLADRAGVTLGTMTAEEKRQRAEVQGLKKVLQRAGQLFGEALRSPEGRPAVEYLKQRGFQGKTAMDYDVGFVPSDFARRLRDAGMSSAAVDRAGFTHAFTGRLSFGIRDQSGVIVGFGARTLDPEGKPKYVNTRETSAFNKRLLLYGLDKAARTVASSRRLVIMEGYTDVMMAAQQGVQDVVASMGTSLTKDHVRMLRSRASNLVFLFDGDRAGQGAAERAVQLTLDEGMEVRVLTLPDGADPADWFEGKNAAAFDSLLLEQAMSTVTFLARRGLERSDKGQPGWRESVASEVLEACRTILDPVRREAIAAEVARACSVDRNSLRAKARATRPSAPVRRPSGGSDTSRREWDKGGATGSGAKAPGSSARSTRPARSTHSPSQGSSADRPAGPSVERPENPDQIPASAYESAPPPEAFDDHESQVHQQAPQQGYAPKSRPGAPGGQSRGGQSRRPGFGQSQPRRGSKTHNARVSSQFVVVAGLAEHADAVQTLAELENIGALDHPGALRLREIALDLLRGPAVTIDVPVDVPVDALVDVAVEAPVDDSYEPGADIDADIGADIGADIDPGIDPDLAAKIAASLDADLDPAFDSEIPALDSLHEDHPGITPDGSPRPPSETEVLEGPVDSMEWIEATRELAPELVPSLERALLVAPGSVLPSYDSALEFLRKQATEDQEREARRAALSRTDIASDEATLKAVYESLQNAQRAKIASQAKGSGPGSIPEPGFGPNTGAPGGAHPTSPSPETGPTSHSSASDPFSATEPEPPTDSSQAFSP